MVVYHTAQLCSATLYGLVDHTAQLYLRRHIAVVHLVVGPGIGIGARCMHFLQAYMYCVTLYAYTISILHINKIQAIKCLDVLHGIP